MVAVSLGGVESLACIPAQSTHYIVPPEIRRVRSPAFGAACFACAVNGGRGYGHEVILLPAASRASEQLSLTKASS